MESLGEVSLPSSDQPSGVSYSLTHGAGSEMVSRVGGLVPLAGAGHLAEEADGSSKDLSCLIIQECLKEEPTATEESLAPQGVFSETTDHQGIYPEARVSQRDFQENSSLHQCSTLDEDRTMLSLTKPGDSAEAATGTESLVIVNVGADGERQSQVLGEDSDQAQQQTGYLVYNPIDRTLRVASPRVTPLLVLANNAEHGTYEANVVLSQSTELSQLVKLNTPAFAETSTDPSTITMTVDADTQLLFNGQQTSGQLLYVCDMNHCGAAFDSLEEFHQHQTCHMTQNSNEYPGDCGAQDRRYSRQLVCSHEGCGRTFTWPSHLKYHELTHVGKRLFRCEVDGCGACFYAVQQLRVHRRVHTGEKPFVCTEPNCGKAFTTQGNLKNHARIHTGEKPYGCDFPECPKRFAEHSSLRKHTLVHTGTKPYECDICGKKFSQSGSRNVHMKRHQVLNEERVLVSESVVFSNATTDHVVTVTTQPAEDGESHHHIACKTEELCQQDDHGNARILTPTAGANVVVLSQPEEMVAMAPGYHHEGGGNPKDMVYACHQLLNVDVS